MLTALLEEAGLLAPAIMVHLATHEVQCLGCSEHAPQELGMPAFHTVTAGRLTKQEAFLAQSTMCSYCFYTCVSVLACWSLVAI